MSGIKAHTLRIWEQRYGLSFCKRKESKHRYFDNEDLKEILAVAHLYHQGYKISRIATLSKEEISQLASEDTGNSLYSGFIGQMLIASLDYNEAGFEKAMEQATEKFGFDETILQIIYPFLEKIGLLWLTGHVIPAQEHFSSCLILRKIIKEIHSLEFSEFAGPETVAVFGPENELHELPLLIIVYLLKRKGVRTRYFGPNVSVSALQYFISHKNVTHLCCHLITNFLPFTADEFIRLIKTEFPAVNCIFSGPAFQHTDSNIQHVTVLRSIKEVWEIDQIVRNMSQPVL